MTSTSVPLVSVCVPAFRAEAFIAATVASVRGQTCTDWELIVLDNASDDGTVAAALAAAGDDRRVTVRVNPTNLGPAGNWNAVVQRARGRFVKLLCSDDLLYPTCLEAQVRALESHTSAVMACARRDVIDGAGWVLFAGRGLQGLPPGLVDGRAAVRAMIRCATTPFGEPSVVLYRREALEIAGPFRGDVGTLIDCDHFARTLRHGDLVALDLTLAAFRVRPASWSDRSHGEQAAAVRRIFRQLAADPDFGATPLDRLLMTVRSELNAHGRRLAFALAARRAASR